MNSVLPSHHWAALLPSLQVNAFNAHYAQVLDERDFAQWPSLFTVDGRYQVQGRENHDRQLPLCLIDLESQAMMRDRVHGITQTIYHAPYYSRHVIGAATAQLLGGDIRAHAPFAVFRTKPGAGGCGVSEVFACGRYIDHFQFDMGGELKLISRLCVLDSENILNSLIYPI